MSEGSGRHDGAWTRAAQAAGLVLLLLAGGALVLGPGELAEALRRGPDAGALTRLLRAAAPALGIVAAGLLVPAIRRRPALLAAFVSFPVAALMVTYHLRPEGLAAWEGDAELFYRMAEDFPWRPGGWWRYRLAVPWLVSVLPVATGVGYALIAVLTVGGAAVLVSLLLRDLGFGDAARHAGALLYLGSFAPLYNTYLYAMPDPAAMAVLLLAARALARRRDRELALWLAVGVLTKEVTLFLLPAHWLWRRRSGLDLRAAGRTLLVGVPAALVFIALRLTEAEELSDFVAGNAFLYPWRHQPKNVARLFSPFAAGWVLLALRRPDRWTLAGAGFAVPVVLSLLVTDAGRMLVFLVPFAVPAMLRGCGAEPTAGRLPGRGAAAACLAVLSMRLWEPFLVLFAVPEPWRRGAALLLVPVVAWLGWTAAGRERS